MLFGFLFIITVFNSFKLFIELLGHLLKLEDACHVSIVKLAGVLFGRPLRYGSHETTWLFTTHSRILVERFPLHCYLGSLLGGSRAEAIVIGRVLLEHCDFVLIRSLLLLSIFLLASWILLLRVNLLAHCDPYLAHFF